MIKKWWYADKYAIETRAQWWKCNGLMVKTLPRWWKRSGEDVMAWWWKRFGAMMKTLKHSDENTKVRWWKGDIISCFHHRTISPSCHRVFTPYFLSFTIVISYHPIFKSVVLCIVIKWNTVLLLPGFCRSEYRRSSLILAVYIYTCSDLLTTIFIKVRIVVYI